LFQEYSTTHNRELEIKPPTRSWRKKSKPINAVVAYRDWLYSANKQVQGTTFKVRIATLAQEKP